MSNTTSIENVILGNPELADHPKLESYLTEYYAAIDAGYEADPALLTEMFVVLIEIAPEEPALQEALVDLETALVEEVISNDASLETNEALSEMLTFYADAIEAGYEPDAETASTLIDALDGVAVTDPVLQETIDSVSEAVQEVLEAPYYNTIGYAQQNGVGIISIATDGTMSSSGFLAFPSSGYTYGTALGDINNDGFLDVVGTGDNSAAYVFYGDGSGGFVDSGLRFAGQFQNRTEITDIDGDGDGDLFFNNVLGEAEVWRNDGGSFTKVFGYSNVGSTGIYGTQSDAQFEDLNGDGAVDMLLVQVDDYASISDLVFLNDGSGNFTLASTLPSGFGYSGPTLADVNGDGAADYIRGTSAGIAVELNDGSGNFTASVSDYGAAFNGTVVVADFNGDGVLDAIRSDPNAVQDNVQLWLGDGADGFVFDSAITSASVGFRSDIQVDDFTGDGIADLLFHSGAGVEAWANDGAGNFALADIFTPGGAIYDTDIGLL